MNDLDTASGMAPGPRSPVMRARLVRPPVLIAARAIILSCALFAAVVALSWLRPGVVRVDLVTAGAGPAGGHSYALRLPISGNWWRAIDADTPQRPAASRLRLSEDGRVLGPAHSAHAEIARLGGGAYSHWGDALYFSAADNADPRANGRRYSVEVPLLLRPLWIIAGFTCAALAVLGAILLWGGHAAALARSLSASWRPADRLSAALAIASVAGSGAALLAGFAALLAPRIELQLDAGHVGAEFGVAYTLTLPQPRSPLYRIVGDLPSHPRQSDLQLTEDGRALGHAHAQHGDIRKLGGGRYSHWNAILLFSASDGSDPRSNGRRYSATVQAQLRPAWQAAGWAGLALAAGCAVLIAVRRPDSRIGTAVGLAGRWIRAGVRPSAVAAMPTSLLLIAAAVAGVVAVLLGWHTGPGTTSASELARYFPISDASGYHGCATALAAKGTMAGFDNDWCVRRVLYVGFLATLLPLSAWSSQGALIAQGALVALAIGLLAVQVRAIAGTLAAAVVALLLAAFAWEFVFGLFMTEALGFPLALAAFALLLGGDRDRRWRLAGAVLLSAALTTRAGAMFLLPALLLWLVWVEWPQPWRRRLAVAAMAGLAVTTGPLLHFLIVSALGVDAGNTGGNYAASLYALSIGSRDWADAYRDFKPLFGQGEKAAFEQIYRIAFDNIASRPEVFVGTLWQALLTYFRTLWVFLPATLPGWLAPTLSALAVVGLLQAMRRARTPWGSLLLLLAAAEVTSAPLIVDSGGVRVFAASIALRVLLSAIGLATLISALLRWLPASAAASALATRATPAAALLLGGGALLMAVVAGTPLLRVAMVEPVSAPTCPAGQQAISARFGRESVSLSVLAEGAGLHSIWPFVVGAARLRGDGPLMEGAYGPDIQALPRPVTLLRAVDLRPEARRAIHMLAIEGAPPVTAGPYGLCVDPAAAVTVANVDFMRVRSMQSLPSR
jgi:hypothetical protein